MRYINLNLLTYLLAPMYASHCCRVSRKSLTQVSNQFSSLTVEVVVAWGLNSVNAFQTGKWTYVYQLQVRRRHNACRGEQPSRNGVGRRQLSTWTRLFQHVAWSYRARWFTGRASGSGSRRQASPRAPQDTSRVASPTGLLPGLCR